MKVSVVGTGYVGLITGLCLSEKGHSVVCVDIDSDKVEKINRGIPTLHEEGLPELLARHLQKSFFASNDLKSAVKATEVTFIAVGTPFQDDQIDLRYVIDAARQIGRAMGEKSEYHLVVVKSTVVPGSCDDVVCPVLENASCMKAGRDFGLCMNPEFLREGQAIADFLSPDRIVIGGIDSRSRKTLLNLYQVFGDVPKICTTNRTAEMIKYASNALFATLISFSNEMANFCASLPNVDIKDVLGGVILDRRLTVRQENGDVVQPAVTSYLEAGCGFGGSCFPKDIKALISEGRKRQSPMEILEKVALTNDHQPLQLLKLLAKHYPSFSSLSVTILGAVFKPGTDDTRESPAIPIIKELSLRGARVLVYDPILAKLDKTLDLDGVLYAKNLESATHEADAIVVVTRWPEFDKLPAILERSKSRPVVIDGRRMLSPFDFERYEGIGRRSEEEVSAQPQE